MALADDATTAVHLVGVLARFGNKAIPIAEALAPWLPYGGPILAALKVAEPIVGGIAQYAPVAEQLIKDGTPVLNALEKASPALLQDLRILYGTATRSVGQDPAYNGLSGFIAAAVMHKPWTPAQEQQWWNNASAVGRG